MGLMSEYTLAISEPEIRRYQLMAATAQQSEADLWRQAGITPGATVGDIGCGPAAMSVLLARTDAPGGRVIGVERDDAALAAARQVVAASALQFGVFQAVRGRGRARGFWVGFVAFGFATMLSFVWSAAFRESTPSLLWIAYTKHANRFLNSVSHVWDFYNRTRIHPVLVATLALVWSVPQLVIALVGGLVARSLSGRPGVGRAGGSGSRTAAPTLPSSV